MKRYMIVVKGTFDRSYVAKMGAKITSTYKHMPQILEIEASESAYYNIIANPYVEAIEEDGDDVIDETITQKEDYGIENLKAHEYWSRGITGKGVKVAVMDSGCQNHEDLKIAGGFNARDLGSPYMHDLGGHGTHVIGIINMQDNNMGYVGIAPESQLYVIKTNPLEGGGHSRAAQIRGIDWCIENDIDVVNCSFSSTNADNPARREAFRIAAEEHDIIIVCASGNRQRDLPPNVNTIHPPASYPFTLAIGNVDEHNKRFVSSGCGSELDFVAPGRRIMSTCIDESSPISAHYCQKTGTSMASPYMTGIVALYKQIFPKLNRLELIEKIKENAIDLGFKQEYGYGLPMPPQELFTIEEETTQKKIEVRSGITIRDKYMNAVIQLENAFNIGYEKEVNSIWNASFSLPLDDPKANKVESLKYVEITDELTNEYIGLFRIMPKLTRKNSQANYVTFECEHVLATLLDSSLFKYHQLSNYDTKYVLEYLMDKQNHKHWKLGNVDFTRFFHYSWENENLLSALLSVPKPFDEAYIFTWDTQNYPWTLNIVKPTTEVVSRIKEGYNLRTLEIEENPMSQFNRIYPLGAGEGVNQLTIESVNNGVPYLEDRKPDEEIKEVVWPDQRYTHAESLKADAQALLDKWKVPQVTWNISAADVSSITGLSVDKFSLGNVVRLDIDDMPTVDLRIMKESKSDIKGDPGDIQLEIGNVVEDLGVTNADLERRQQVNELYSQGATNIMNFTYQDNCDNNMPATIPFYIDDDVVNINTIELSFRTKRFRAYSQATKGGGGTTRTTSGGGGTTQTTTSGGGSTATSSSGGGTSRSTNSGGGSTRTSAAGGDHTHTMFVKTSASGPPGLNAYNSRAGIVHLNATGDNITTHGSSGNHTHSVSVPAHSHDFSTPNHTHSVQIPNHSHSLTLNPHTHNLTLPDHTHEVAHKIIELSQLPSSVKIEVDGNTVPHTSLIGNRIDLAEHMSKDSGGRISRGRHEVTITPIGGNGGLARIEADLILRVFIQSQLGNTY